MSPAARVKADIEMDSKIFIYSVQGIESDFLESNPKIFDGFELAMTPKRLTEETIELSKGSPAICAFVNDVLDSAVLERLAENGVRFILMRCAGYNNVALETAGRLGMRVLRVPAYSPYAVAEFAVTLLLSVNRQIVKAANRTRDHDFSLHGALIGSDIFGKTVGVIGTGKIGRIFCKIMKGFGCEVIAYDLYPNDETKSLGVEYCGLDDVLGRADIISLHCPLLESTRHIINADAVDKMKRGVTLINTSRGALVDSSAIVEGIKSGKIGALGMDVYENESAMYFKDLSHEILHDSVFLQLQGYPNVLITPHLAFCTKEALSSIWRTTRENADAVLAASGGDALANEVRVDL